MLDSFNRNPYTWQDSVNSPLHAAHPVLTAHPGRSAEQVKKEALMAPKSLINPKTGGRK